MADIGHFYVEKICEFGWGEGVKLSKNAVVGIVRVLYNENNTNVN